MDTRLAATVPFMTFVLPMTVVTFDTSRLSGFSLSPLPKRPIWEDGLTVQTTFGALLQASPSLPAGGLLGKQKKKNGPLEAPLLP
jgi:hypothetical protein